VTSSVEASKSKKYSVSELIWLALINAESDRESYADAVGKNTDEGREALNLVRQFRAYRLRRFGRSFGEAAIENSVLIPARPTEKYLPDETVRCRKTCIYAQGGFCNTPNVNRGNSDAYCHERPLLEVLTWLAQDATRNLSDDHEVQR
jgi:hypothetical protein